jgi:diguanylate cyclase (GGDEF)-like protein
MSWILDKTRLRPSRVAPGALPDSSGAEHGEAKELIRLRQLDADRRRFFHELVAEESFEIILRGLARMLESQLPGSRVAVIIPGEGRFFATRPDETDQTLMESATVAIAAYSAIGGADARRGSGNWSEIAASDIASDPIWTAGRAAAEHKKLRSCWTALIPASHGSCAGAICLLLPETRQPGEGEAELIRAATAQAGIAIRQHRLGQQLMHQALHDTITGLPNRALLQDRLTQAINQAHRNKEQVGLFLLDIDGFKFINDTLGQSDGDSLLRAFAERLESVVRRSDTLARVKGDEFIFVASNLDDERGSAAVAEKLLGMLSKPFVIDGRELFLTASLGVSIFPIDGTDAATLQRNSEAALARAKSQGRGKMAFFAPEMNAAALERLQLEAELRHAIGNQEFRLHYQPQVDFRGQCIAVEALVRWQHRDDRRGRRPAGRLRGGGLRVVGRSGLRRPGPARPTAKVPDGHGRLMWALAIARATARSIAGSTTLTPPATFTKTSSAARRRPQRFSSTAMIMPTRSELTPLTLRRAAPMTLPAVRACTSSSSTRLPCMAAVRMDPLGGPSGPCCSTKRLPGSVTSLRPAPVISKQADFVGAAEAVLDAADDAVAVEAVAFEIDDGVDDVLDDLGAGERAGLGDMADEDDGGAAGFGEIDQFHAAIAKLGDRAGGGGEIGLVDHLDRIDHDDGGLEFVDLIDDPLDVGLGEDQQLWGGDAQARGAHLGLSGGFFAGDVEDADAGGTGSCLGGCGRARDRGRAAGAGGEVAGDLARSNVLLPMPGSPPTRTAEPGTMPPPRMRSNSPVPVAMRGTSSRSMSASGEGIDAVGDVGGLGAGFVGIGRRGFVFLEAVPGSAVGAFAHPLGVDAATLVAEELGAGFGHWFSPFSTRPTSGNPSTCLPSIRWIIKP